MTLDRILPFTKYLLAKVVNFGDFVIDATVGNGNDTEFLSQLVGNNGHVFGFDIQQTAIDSTAARLKTAEINNASLICDGHENILQHASAEITAAIFNLGYLPGSDKTITTNSTTTWKAVVDIFSLLKIGGIIILVIYHGHETGKIERDEIETAVATLDPAKTAVLRYEFLNKTNAPYIIAIEKIKHS